MRRLVTVVAVVTLLGLLVWGAGHGLGVRSPDMDGGPGSRSGIGNDSRLEGAPTTVAEEAGAVLLGEVRRGGLPAKAGLELRRRDDVGAISEVLATASSGSDGRFAFRGLAPGTFAVQALDENGRIGGVTGDIEHPGQHARVDVVIEDGPHDLRGLALHRDGRPFKGVIAVDRGMFSGGSRWYTSLGDDGAFVLRGLPAGTLRLCGGMPDGSWLPWRNVTVPHEGVLRLVVDDGMREIGGRVVRAADGAPVANAEVSVRTGAQWDRQVHATVRTGPDGRWAAVAPDAGADILVRADGFAPGHDLLTPEESTITTRLWVEGRVMGVVVGPDGDPVAGVTIQARRLVVFRTVTSGAAGQFVLDGLSTGVVEIGATGPDHVSSGPWIPVAVEAGRSVDVEIPVRAAVRAEGRALRADGSGANGATVTARCLSDGGANRATAAAADGSFVLDGLVPGALYGFSAESHDLHSASAGPLRAPARGSLSVALGFPEPRWVDVLVIDRRTGQPAGGAHVIVMALDPGSPHPNGYGWWTESGRVRVGPLPPGRLAICAELTSHDVGADPEMVLVEPGEMVLSVESRACRIIRVQARFEDGTPARGGRVDYNVFEPGNTGGFHDCLYDLDCVTDSAGRFEFECPLESRCFVGVRISRDGHRHAGKTIVEAERTEVDLVLRPTGEIDDEVTLRLRVLGCDGRPLSDGDVWSSILSSSGSARVQSIRSGIRDGIWEARVSPSDARLALAIRPIENGPGPRSAHMYLAPVNADAGEVEVRLPEGRTIAGHVLDEERRPVAGIQVAARHWHKDLGEASWAIAVTDSAGAFRLRGLADLTYRLVVTTSMDWVSQKSVSVPAGSDGVTVVLRRGASVVVHVLDARGSPVGGARIEVRSSDAHCEETDADGAARIRGLDPDRCHKLVVMPPRDRTDLALRVLEEWRPADTEVWLDDRFSVRGVVRDEDGRGVAGARIGRLPGRFASPNEYLATSDPDGRFHVTGLEPGEVTLVAMPDGVFDHLLGGPPVTVAAGSDSVVLRVPRTKELIIRLDPWPSAAWVWIRLEIPDRGWGRADWPRGESPYRLRLPAGEACDVFVFVSGGKQVAHATGIRTDAGQVTLRLVSSAAIHGRIVLPEGGRCVEVRASGPAVAMPGKVESNGRFRIEGLPPGEWCVRVVWTLGDARHTTEVRAATGAETTIHCPVR